MVNIHMVRPKIPTVRKALSVLLTLVLLSALLPGGTSTPAPSDGLTAAGLPDAWRHGADLRVEDGEVHGARLQEQLDPSRHVLPDGTYDLRALVTAMREVAGSDGGILAPVPTSEEIEVASHQSGRFHWGLPGGDLDGDGLDEVIDYSIDLTALDINVSAVDGDGRFTWSKQFPAVGGYYDAFPMESTDLTGDGANDVVILALRMLGDEDAHCFILACAGAAAFSGAWEVHVVDGSTGATLSVREEPLQVTVADVIASAVAGFAFAYAVSGIGLGILVDLSDDVDGDGAADLVVDRLDASFTVTFAGAPFVLAALYAETYKAHYAVARADGSTISSGDLGPATGPPLALPAGDIDGDGLGDLLALEPFTGNYAIACVLLCAGTGASVQTTLYGLRGADGATLWAQTIPGLGEDRILLGVDDLNGDGVGDFLFGVVPTAGADHIQAFDGTAGAPLYASPVDGFYYVPVGDLDGDGGTDLLAARDLDGDVTLRAASGATGSVLWQAPIDTAIEWVFFVDFRDAGDVDGDGRTDILALTVGVTGHDLVIEASVLDADGATLWTLDGDSYMIPTGDLDGTGGNDLAALRLAVEGNGLEWTVSAHTGSTGATLWAANETLVRRSSATIESSGDIDGDGTDDLLHSALTEDAGFVVAGRMQALNGADGATLLTIGSTLQEPVPLVQDDAGSGRDAGSSRGSAVSITNGTFDGRLEPSQGDHDDHYLIHVEEGQTLAVTLAPHGVDYDLELYDPDDEWVGSSWNGGDETDTVEIIAAKTGDYRIAVLDWDPIDANYTLGASVDGQGNPDPDPEPEPEPVEPHTATFVFSGHIGCAASAALVATNDRCGTIDAATAEKFPVPLERGVSGVHVELRWEEADTAGAERLRFAWVAPPGLGGGEGTSPLVHDQPVDNGTSWAEHPQNGTLHVRVGDDQGVVLQQDFEVCTTILYGGAALPEGSCFDA